MNNKSDDTRKCTRNSEEFTQIDDQYRKSRSIDLGRYYSYSIDYDIKHLGFVFSRYKFAARMMENRNTINVLELGCSYGLGTQFFLQTKAVDKYIGVDLDDEAISYARSTFGTNKSNFLRDDFLGKDYTKYIEAQGFDAIVSIDVIEHIETEFERDVVDTIYNNLSSDGFAIIGTPNIAMKSHASAASLAAHVNWFDQEHLYSLMTTRFANVFIFGMTDEVVHTGFYPFCCYIFALCTNKKET